MTKERVSESRLSPDRQRERAGAVRGSQIRPTQHGLCARLHQLEANRNYYRCGAVEP